MQTFKREILSSLLLLVLLAGCAPGPAVRPGAEGPSDPRVEQAISLESTSDYLAAAELYEQIADSKSGPARQRMLLSAARNRLLGQDLEGATAILSGIGISGVEDLDFEARLLTAELALARNRPDDALELLRSPAPENLPIDLLVRYHKDRAKAFRLAGNLLESARELGQLDFLLLDPDARLENQLEIIQTYAVLTDAALENLQPDPPGVQGGWMELTRIIKRHAGDPQGIQPLIATWQERFPTHPAMPELLEGYFERLKAQYRRPNHIAVLLPESGPYARVAAALRDGILAAYYSQESDERPQLAFYDSTNPDQTWPLYQRAIDSGADMVIGPLNKQGVAQFTRAGEIEIPVLSLNQVQPEVMPPADLYQFGLSPEDEARQVAERAWVDGLTTALVLTPQDGWGDRIFNAFRERWEWLGGVVAEHQTYDPKEHDFAQPIRSLLNLDESDARRQVLQLKLGKKLEFEPRRRQDGDFIFLAAKTRLARQIRPQLQFHHAENLPVYTTSHIFSGHVSADNDIDLEGMKFPDIPWVLLEEGNTPLSREALTGMLGLEKNPYLRLYALGMDSYMLLPHLARLQSSSRESLEGKTGNLYMDRINHIHRQLVWAQIERGTPRIIGFAPRLDDPPPLVLPKAEPEDTESFDVLPELLPPLQDPGEEPVQGDPLPELLPPSQDTGEEPAHDQVTQ